MRLVEFNVSGVLTSVNIEQVLSVKPVSTTDPRQGTWINLVGGGSLRVKDLYADVVAALQPTA